MASPVEKVRLWDVLESDSLQEVHDVLQDGLLRQVFHVLRVLPHDEHLQHVGGTVHARHVHDVIQP